MTFTDEDDLILDPVKAKKLRKGNLPKLGATPFANLMPPSELAIRESRNLIRNMSFVAIFVFIILMGLWAWSHLQLIDANQRLTEVREENNIIVSNQAKYSETAQITDRIAAIGIVNEQIDISKIDWYVLSSQLFDALPEKASISNINFEILTPDQTVDNQWAIKANISGTSTQVTLVETYVQNLRDLGANITQISQDLKANKTYEFTVNADFPMNNYKEAE